MSHAGKRAKERFGIKLTADDYKLIRGRILAGNGVEYLGPGLNGATKWLVPVNKHPMVVVFESRTGRICTVYEKENN